jgi:CRISPR-associated endonuclease/helicase Cas3
VRLPDEMEVLIEMVYGESPLPGHDATWQAALANSRQELEENQARDRQTARKFLIKPPDYEDDLLEDFSQELEEDNPEVHPTLQALTRLGERNVTVVCLYRTVDGVALRPDGRDPVDVAREPGLSEVKRLLRSALTLSHFSVVTHFLAQSPPAG